MKASLNFSTGVNAGVPSFSVDLSIICDLYVKFKCSVVEIRGF